MAAHRRRTKIMALFLGSAAVLDLPFVYALAPMFGLALGFVLCCIIAFWFAARPVTGMYGAWLLTLSLLLTVVLAVPLRVLAANQLLIMVYIIPPLVGGFLVSANATLLLSGLISALLGGQLILLPTPFTFDPFIPFGMMFTCSMGLVWFILRNLEHMAQAGLVVAQQALAAQQSMLQREHELSYKTNELQTLYVDQYAMMETIQQLEAPLLPLTEEIVLIPLMGLLDTHRIAKITDRLLQTVCRQVIRGVVLDMSGIPIVNQAIAEHVSDLIRSCHLMGAMVILSGTSNAIAEDLGRYGAISYGIRTTASLETAIDELRTLFI